MLGQRPDDKIAGVLIYTLGKLKDTLAVPEISSYYTHKNERMRLRVAEALQNIKDTLGLRVLIPLLFDSSYLVKVASIEGIANLGKKGLERVESELKNALSEENRTILIKTLCRTYDKMDNKDKTSELKKQLAQIGQKYIKSDYPALKKESQRLIDSVEGRGSLEPDILFLYPETPEN
jgi:HEAT repeat protein